MRSIRTKKVPGAPRPQSGLDNRAKLLRLRAGRSAGSTARAAAGRMANAMACIVMGFSRKRLRQNGKCFESFSGNVQWSGYHEQPRSNLQRFSKTHDEAPAYVDDLVDI